LIELKSKEPSRTGFPEHLDIKPLEETLKVDDTIQTHRFNKDILNIASQYLSDTHELCEFTCRRRDSLEEDEQLLNNTYQLKEREDIREADESPSPEVHRRDKSAPPKFISHSFIN
jgi:hypothetical protein